MRTRASDIASWALGLSVPIQYCYLIKSGNGAAANDLDTHYTELTAAALVALRFEIQP